MSPCPSIELSSHICALCRPGLLQSSSVKDVGPNSVSEVTGSPDFISSVALLPGGGGFQCQPGHREKVTGEEPARVHLVPSPLSVAWLLKGAAFLGHTPLQQNQSITD